MVAGAQELSGDNSTILYTFLREDVVKIEGMAKTVEVARIREKLEGQKLLQIGEVEERGELPLEVFF